MSWALDPFSSFSWPSVLGRKMISSWACCYRLVGRVHLPFAWWEQALVITKTAGHNECTVRLLQDTEPKMNFHFLKQEVHLHFGSTLFMQGKRKRWQGGSTSWNQRTIARVCVAQAGWQVMNVRAEMRPPTLREELAVACNPVTAWKSSPRIFWFSGVLCLCHEWYGWH